MSGIDLTPTCQINPVGLPSTDQSVVVICPKVNVPFLEELNLSDKMLRVIITNVLSSKWLGGKQAQDIVKLCQSHNPEHVEHGKQFITFPKLK